MRVLLIEHHRLLARPLKQGLEEEGFSVVLAHSCVEGDSEALTAGYDAIILNPQLPEGGDDGLHRLRRWRGNGLRTPVLVLTACCCAGDEAFARGLGADAYLRMPFALTQVFDWLRGLT